MFVGTFQNNLRVRHFNESFVQNLVVFMTKIRAYDEYYIKGEKSNVQKKDIDIKERTYGEFDLLS